MTALATRAHHDAGLRAGFSHRRTATSTIAHIAEAARQIRIQDLEAGALRRAGHIGGDFSAIDILATLYGAVLNVTPETVDDPERDRFILSKGHVAGALYTTLAAFGFLAGRRSWRPSCKPLSALNGHPNRTKVRGSRGQHRPARARAADRGRPRASRQARRLAPPHLRARRRRRAAGGQQLGGA